MGLRLKREEQLKVVGMHCATCEATVSKAIRGVKGVSDVRVNLATGEARVVLEDSRKLREVIQAVRRAGYDVVTQKFVLSIEASEEEMARVKEIVEDVDGVIEARAGRGTLIVEVNPLTTTPQAVVEELRRRGYRAEVLNRAMPGRRSDFGDLLTRLIIGVVFTALVLISPSPFLALAFTLPVQFYSGLRFHRGAMRALRNKTTNMDVLVSLSSNAAWVYSLLTMSQFSAPALLITFVLTGKTLEAYLKERASREVVPNVNFRARKEDGTVVDSSSLRPGDIVIVKAGERIPADGVVEDGEGYVDESIFTGETIPTYKRKGDPVIGGSLLTSGFLKVYVTRAGERAYLAQVAEAVREAEAVRLPIQDFVDRVSQLFVPTIIAISAIAFLVWHFVLNSSLAITIAIAVLASACPCGFGLATPMAIVVGLRKLLRRGIVVRNGEAFERLGKVKAFVFDKTGTVTKGTIRVSRYEGEVELAAALEKLSNHPVANAIAKLGKGEHKVENFMEFRGEGAYGRVDEREVIVGKREFVLNNCQGEDKGADVLVCVDGEVRGWVWLEDEIRDEAFEVIKWLKDRGYEVVIATGDSSRIADVVGQKLGVKVYKGLSPEEKAELVRGKNAAFVGDGVNDAFALKEALVGIAVSTGSDLAKLAGDVVVPSIKAIPDLVKQSRRTVRKVRENVLWALAYNSVLVPIAAGVLYPFYLPPEYAALAMSMNSVSVVLWSFVQ